jgi:hypothetical protein
VKQEFIIKPSNPLSAKSRAVISLHGKYRYFPEGNADKVRYLDNGKATRKDKELRVPSIISVSFPVMVRYDTARQVLLTAFVTGNRVVTGAPNVDVFSRSISCKSVSDDLSSDVSRLFPPWSGDCNSGGHQICSFDKSKSRFYGRDDSSIKMIPACISNLVKLEHLDLSDTSVSKIEGLENNVKLERLDLYGTGIKKIEGLEKNVELKELYLTRTGVSKIENLENNVNLNGLSLSKTDVSKIEGLENNVELKKLYLTRTGVSKIENLENNVKLELLDLSKTNVSKIEGLGNNIKLDWFKLSNTGVRKIEGLGKNVNLKRLSLSRTGVKKSDCDEFKKARPGVSLSC